MRIRQVFISGLVCLAIPGQSYGGCNGLWKYLLAAAPFLAAGGVGAYKIADGGDAARRRTCEGSGGTYRQSNNSYGNFDSCWCPQGSYFREPGAAGTTSYGDPIHIAGEASGRRQLARGHYLISMKRYRKFDTWAEGSCDGAASMVAAEEDAHALDHVLAWAYRSPALDEVLARGTEHGLLWEYVRRRVDPAQLKSDHHPEKRVQNDGYGPYRIAIDDPEYSVPAAADFHRIERDASDGLYALPSGEKRASEIARFSSEYRRSVLLLQLGDIQDKLERAQESEAANKVAGWMDAIRRDQAGDPGLVSSFQSEAQKDLGEALRRALVKLSVK